MHSYDTPANESLSTISEECHDCRNMYYAVVCILAHYQPGVRAACSNRSCPRALWLAKSALQVTVEKRVGTCRDAVNFARTLAWPLKPLYVNQYIFLVILRPVSLDSMPIVLIATLAGGVQCQVPGSMQRLLFVSTDARPAYAHKVP
jgi:hypothetical protein